MKKMKNLLTLILCTSAFVLFGQSNEFQGKITYQIQYLDSLGNKLDRGSPKKDRKMYYFISNGNYKSLNEKGEISQLYNSSSNKYYFNYQGQIQSVDASIQFPKSGKVKKLKGEQKVLGKNCKSLRITSELGITTYFYSDDVKVNHKDFTNHNFGNWNLFLKSTLGSLAIKYETVDPNTGEITLMEAIEIKEMELTKEDFDIKTYMKK